MPQPIHCHPRAFHLFAGYLASADTNEGLLRAVAAISMHELESAEPEEVARRLSGLAQRVRARLRSNRVDAVLAHLHEVLFEEEGFAGNTEDYFNPYNSYLPAVLESRRGIPITLSLIYKVVGEQLGLRIEGVNAPGHFLARLRIDDGMMLVDPFAGGRLLTPEEAIERIEEVTGRTVLPGGRYLAIATHRVWLARVLVNLQNIFASLGRSDDLAAMVELQSLVQEAPQ